MTTQHKPTYFDQFAEFIVEKGPSQNFWFVVFIISFTTLIIWLILKGLGVINTPWWIANLPYFVGVASLISFLIVIVEKALKIGNRFGAFETKLEYVGHDLKELRTDYRAHLVKYHA